MVRTLPAPSLRELSSECETEGVYPDERNHSKISEPIKNCEETLGPEQPSDDTPSVTPCGRQSVKEPQLSASESWGLSVILAVTNKYP